MQHFNIISIDGGTTPVTPQALYDADVAGLPITVDLTPFPTLSAMIARAAPAQRVEDLHALTNLLFNYGYESLQNLERKLTS